MSPGLEQYGANDYVRQREFIEKRIAEEPAGIRAEIAEVKLAARVPQARNEK